jgi:hypothetical protein
MVSAMALRALARRQCALRISLTDPVAALSAQIRIAGPPRRGARGTATANVALSLHAPREETTMRWKISRHGHDPRQVDLLAVIALVIIIVAAWRYFGEDSEPRNTTAFIVPSQSTHW